MSTAVIEPCPNRQPAPPGGENASAAPPITVTAAVIEDRGRVLIVRKRPGTRHAGQWEFPGGKVEAGEGPQACLAREVLEELGIGVRPTGFLCETVHAYPHATIRLLAFRVRWLSGRIQLTDHDAMAWVLPAALADWDLLPADIAIAEALIDPSRGAAEKNTGSVEKAAPLPAGRAPAVEAPC